MSEKKTETAKEKMVKVYVPRDPLDPRTHLFVSINERNFMVELDRWVEVPMCVALVLKGREKRLRRKDEHARAAKAAMNTAALN